MVGQFFSHPLQESVARIVSITIQTETLVQRAVQKFIVGIERP
jgi:hypothetical protein